MRVVVQILIVLVVLGVAGGIAKWMVDNRPEVEPEPVEVAMPVVEVVVVRAEPFQRTVRGRGEVAPRERTRLVSEVDGRVADLSPALVSGGSFAEGDVLVTLDPVDLEVARARAAASLEQAETALAREAAEAEVARRHYAELGEGQASDLALRKPQVDEAQARVDAAAADLARADRDLKRTEIAAPFTGRVRSEDVGLGQLVTRGQVLADLFATDRAEVRVPVPNGELAHLGLSGFGLLEDGPATSLFADFAGAPRRWSGRVLRIEGEVDRTSRMVTLVVGVDDPYGAAAQAAGAPLMPGLFVDAEIDGIRDDSAQLLPRAVLRANDRVHVVDADLRLRFRAVVTGWRDAERVLILAGLEEGERVCISPLAAPVDGMRVRLLEGDGAAPAAGGAE